jgi:hypothetical protein
LREASLHIDRSGTPAAFLTAGEKGKGRSPLTRITIITIGYLQNLEQELLQLLGDLDEAKQKEIAHFVTSRVHESWTNGVEHGKASAKLDHLEQGLRGAGKRFADRR